MISLGAALAPKAIPGLSEAGHNFYTLLGAETLRDALRRFSGGRIVVLTAAPAYKCPAAPYEAALLIESYLRKRGVGQFTVDLYAAESGPMGVAGPEVSHAVRQMVEGRGILYHPEHQVVSVEPSARQITFANGTTAQYDLLAYVPPHRAPSVVADAGLAEMDGSRSIATMATRFEASTRSAMSLAFRSSWASRCQRASSPWRSGGGDSEPRGCRPGKTPTSASTATARASSRWATASRLRRGKLLPSPNQS